MWAARAMQLADAGIRKEQMSIKADEGVSRRESNLDLLGQSRNV